MLTTTLVRARGLLHRILDPEGDQAIKLIRRDLRRFTKKLQELEEAQRSTTELVRRADRTSMQVKLVSVLNRQQHEDIDRLPALLDEQRITDHVQRQVAAAPLLTDPYDHVVVERVLPDEVYDLLIRAIPPVEFFDDKDPIKQNLRFPMEFGPTLSSTAWQFMDDVIARRAIRSAVLDKFREPLDRHFASVFGAAFLERARQMPQSANGGRLMLRRPGYHLQPHRDPKHSMLTCLMYFAREGDSDVYGTQIFRVFDDGQAGYKQTYYPEQDGRRCELVKLVPFRPNTMLVFLNSRGAHGATIPREAPADLERYSYQFYLSPQHEALSSLVKSLAPEQRAMWRNKTNVKPEYA